METRRRNESRLALILGVVVLLAGGCDRRASRPNVLLITLDTTRADFFGTYGHPGGATPTFDALARRGLLFESAISTAAVTPVSHASILTGLNPYRHGLRVLAAESGYFLPKDVPTLATMLREAGWRTGTVHSAFPVSPYFGLGEGFDFIDTIEAKLVESGQRVRWNVARFQRRSDDTTDRALGFVAGSDSPYFLWVHYWDPHDVQLLPPKEYHPGTNAQKARRDRGLYAAEVRYMDRQVGRLLQGLGERGALENTIVVVTSDHGDGLGDHNWVAHRLLYQEQIHVPLILASPGRREAAPVRGVVRTVDIVPTVLDQVGVAVPPGLDGRRFEALRSGRTESSRVAYADQINGYDRNANVASRRPLDAFLYCVIMDSWKLIYRPLHPDQSELYDLNRDPAEATNRYDEEKDVRERLQRELARREPWVLAPFSASARSDDPEQAAAQEALESLGYAGSPDSDEGVTDWVWSCPRHPDLVTEEREPCVECGDPPLPRSRP